MSCRNDGSCEYASGVLRVASPVSEEQRVRALAFLYWVRDLLLRAGDEARARVWQAEINRIEKSEAILHA